MIRKLWTRMEVQGKPSTLLDGNTEFDPNH